MSANSIIMSKQLVLALRTHLYFKQQLLLLFLNTMQKLLLIWC